MFQGQLESACKLACPIFLVLFDDFGRLARRQVFLPQCSRLLEAAGDCRGNYGRGIACRETLFESLGELFFQLRVIFRAPGSSTSCHGFHLDVRRDD